MENKKVKISGKVRFAGYDKESKKAVVTLIVTDTTLEKLEELLGDTSEYKHTPIKTSKDNETYIKASTSFDFGIVEYSEKAQYYIDSDTSLEDIGKDSDVVIAVCIQESTYKKQTSLVAYLQGIEIKDLVPFEKYNPFEDDLEEL